MSVHISDSNCHSQLSVMPALDSSNSYALQVRVWPILGAVGPFREVSDLKKGKGAWAKKKYIKKEEEKRVAQRL